MLAFEDLHWADPTTLELMKGLAERGALAPLFVIATTRPEFRAPWGARSHHGAISLTPLDRAQVASMVLEMAAKHALSADVIAGVSERTGGVPLFVEEVTRLLLESGADGRAKLPPTLAQSLTARLDRLGPAREVAMVGAVLGRGFSYALLRAVAGLDETPLEEALEKLAEADILLVEGLPPEAEYRFKHALIQDAAYENLLKSRRQALHRKVSETLRDQFPTRAEAQPEVLAHHFTEGGLNEAAIDWWGKAGDIALRRSAFPEAIAHLGKAIEMANKTAGSLSHRPKEVDSANQREKLQSDYGRALMWTKGFSSQESKAAFARVADFATSSKDALARFAAYDAQCQSSWMRGENAAAQQIAEDFLRQAEAEGRATETGAARRALGFVLLMKGNLTAARSLLEHALADYAPARDGDSQQYFTRDTEVTSAVYLALVEWQLGEPERARDLIDRGIRRANELGHAGAIANALFWKATLETTREDASAASVAAENLLLVAEKYRIKTYAEIGQFYASWARARLSDPEEGKLELERGLSEFLAQGNKVGVPSFYGMLAELETLTNNPERALARIDEGLGIADETGEQIWAPYLNRLRGVALRTVEPVNLKSVEIAFRVAGAIADKQGARSEKLLSSLSLAKVLESTDRPVEAHDILSVALDRFEPTPEMPEIAEGKKLLAALAEKEECKSALASRERRLKLQTSYGQALGWSKGFAAEETKSALAQAQMLATQSENIDERMKAHYARWLALHVGGRLAPAQEVAETFLREAKSADDAPGAASAERVLGANRLFQGRFAQAREHLCEAQRIYDPGWEAPVRRLHGVDPGIIAKAILASVAWHLGDVPGAAAYWDEASTEAIADEHVPTIANALWYGAQYQAARGAADATLRVANALLDVSERNGLQFYTIGARAFLNWARTRQGDADALAQFKSQGQAFIDLGGRLLAPLFYGRLAELEAEKSLGEAALTSIDRAIESAHAGDIQYIDSLLQRIRGDILLRRDPANVAPAKEAFLTAIAVAREQGARSFGLQAALKLAELYQSTARPVEAHDILAPALDGFELTLEMPEIAEGKALLAALAETEECKSSATSRQRRLKLQTSYGQAMAWSKGFASDDTKAALEQTHMLAAQTENVDERMKAHFARWVALFVGGKLKAANTVAENFLHDAKLMGDAAAAATAERNLGLTCLHQGGFAQAGKHLSESLRLFDPKWEVGVRRRFGAEGGILAKTNLARIAWFVGDATGAAALFKEALTDALASEHAATIAMASWLKTEDDMVRGDLDATLRGATVQLEVSEKYGMRLFESMARVCLSWVRARSGATDEFERFRDQVETTIVKNDAVMAPLFRGRLAELEAEQMSPNHALISIDRAIELAREDDNRYVDSLLHRIRGDILLKARPSDAPLAFAAYHAAIAVAREQGARTFELLAALPLARLLQSAGRLDEAHGILVVALEGFMPTPELPAIAEAQALQVELSGVA